MNQYHIPLFLTWLLLLPFIACRPLSCQAAETESAASWAAASSLRLVIASDLHYLSPKLTDGGEKFMQIIESADGKAMLYIEEITDAFIAEMLAASPDCIIISGDLTFNGARQSHEDLAAKLKRLTDADIPVLVIPGNHDIDNKSAAKFEGSSYTLVPSLSAGEFSDMYQAFGLSDALYRDSASLSYVYAPTSDLWICMLDTNALTDNVISDETLAWLDKILTEADEKQIQVITVSHQNLLAHNPLFVSGFQITNADALRRVLDSHHVLCHFSGHMHLQHIAEDSIPEVVTSSLALSPNQYGLLSYEGGTLSYSTVKLDVSAWAVAQSSENEDLLHFADYAESFFKDTGYAQMSNALAADETLSGTQKQLLADTFTQLNLAYFSGDALQTAELSEGITLWQEQPASFYSVYISSILEDMEKDFHSFTVSADSSE